jgi:hypothetical protein
MHKHGLIAFNHAIAAEPREQMMHRSKERAYPGKAEVFGRQSHPDFLQFGACERLPDAPVRAESRC